MSSEDFAQRVKSPVFHLGLSAANLIVLIGLIFGAGSYWHEFDTLRTEVPKLSETVSKLRESVVRLELTVQFMAAARSQRRSRQPVRRR